MAIPIPPNLPISPVVDFHRNDLITPPSAPAVVESLGAIDPRVALRMPLPVGDSSAGAAMHDALQNAAARAGAAVASEPSVDQAVLLELSSMTADLAEAAGNPSQARVTNLLSQSLARMDTLGGAALGQMLSDILAVDVPELGQSVTTDAKSAATQSAVVSWPAASAQTPLVSVADPKLAMNTLYQNLQSSGIFAADQLKRLLFPASEDDGAPLATSNSVETETANLVGQLSTDSPAVRDSVKLLLRGDILWQGQLMPNVQGRLYREDAWEADPDQPGQLQKGSRITMEVTLPNLGPFKVVGTQFGESVHVAVEGAPEAQSTLTNAFSDLLEQMRSQVDPDAKVSLKGGGSSNG
ncbi:hypothetical protein [Polynucleobacter sp. AP-Ainpum-60-G11]|uniref:hypothetical protein n=1 Tax=Polynucleobacter sp. AP-Ainpum-60-G11 TaxID=2576926 RepID=UPI001BFD716A|nr:hypothetical protein [Polynucleobacter sp. AP-Ainpum-60-G11]QWE27148.1 hypothetical protein FD971_02335 [Polynucleobacter sp. AP-Ainpum-60-G11]